MKKFLAILSSLAIVPTAALPVVACGSSKNATPLPIPQGQFKIDNALRSSNSLFLTIEQLNGIKFTAKKFVTSDWIHQFEINVNNKNYYDFLSSSDFNYDVSNNTLSLKITDSNLINTMDRFHPANLKVPDTKNITGGHFSI